MQQKRTLYLPLRSLLFLVPIFLSVAPISTEAEEILRFDSVVEVMESGVLQVTENIQYDFGENDRHGIFRTIPGIFESNEERYRMHLEVISVGDENGDSYPFDVETSRSHYRVQIGDPDQTISGTKTYILTYAVKNALIPLEEFDEIYWNANGNKWDVKIASATLQIVLPTSIGSVEPLNTFCYVGLLGSDTPCDSKRVLAEGERTVIEFSASDLKPGESLTGAVSFPKGIVSEPMLVLAGLPRELLLFIYGAFGVGLVTLGLWTVSHWRRHGRDPKGRGVIVREYDAPPGMAPAEVGLIVDQKIDSRDVTAEIVFLAEHGFMHILAIPQTSPLSRGSNYYLLKVRESDDSLKTYQKNLFNSLFSPKNTLTLREVENLEEAILKNNKIKTDIKEVLNKLNTASKVVSVSALGSSTGGDSFYFKLGEVKEELMNTMTEEGYFPSNPSEIRRRYVGLMITGVMSAVLLVAIFSVTGMEELIALGVLFGAALTVVGISLSLVMVKRSEKGVAAREHSLGLKEYLAIAEKDRLEFHFNPKNNPELFERLLPFAIALGVEKQWARELEDISIDPSWYSDASMQGFTVGAFSNSFSGFSSASMASYSTVAGSASTGGGFSGGGAGGGGGGSW